MFTRLFNDTELIYGCLKNTKGTFVCLPPRNGKTCPSGTQTSSRSFLSCKSELLCGLSTHSAILFPSSRLGGCELAVKSTRPPLVWFMSLDFRPLLSSHSGSGSLGSHAALSPSCSERRRAPMVSFAIVQISVCQTATESTSCSHSLLLCDTKDASWLTVVVFLTYCLTAALEASLLTQGQQ